MPAPDLLDSIDRALDRRTDLLVRLADEDTDCCRLFHGVVEGEPGLAIDRYGPLLLLQTWREPLGHDEAERLGAHVAARLGIAPVIAANHRGAGAGFGPHEPGEAALQPHVCREAGLRFNVRARHRGADPWLFLDLRAGRAALRRLAAGRSVLNLFAYTCSAGVAALAGGAVQVTNVDFAQSALAVGADNLALNDQQGRAELLQADCLAVLRQLAGQPVQRRGRHRSFPKVEPRPFDAVFLDPPRWARGPFGAVDVVRDYASLFKPSLLTLAPDGVVVATNHVPEVAADDWCEALRRCAAKAGRPLRDLELVRPDDDFPTFDGQPPLKIAICRT
ncbi:MAG: class I SAM-dependent methyltransferase [Planctomycetota bacterium]